MKETFITKSLFTRCSQVHTPKLSISCLLERIHAIFLCSLEYGPIWMRFMGTFQHITAPIVDSWERILENLVIRYNHCGREGKRQGEFSEQTATAISFKGCCSTKWARQGKGVGKTEKTLGRWWWKVVFLGEGTESPEQKRFGNGAWRTGVMCWKSVKELRSTAGTWTLGQEGWEGILSSRHPVSHTKSVWDGIIFSQT